MKLVREAVGEESKMKGDRHYFRIIGTREDTDLIERIEKELGKCLTGNTIFSAYHQKMIPETYRHGYSDWCAGDEYYGGGCGWFVTIDDIPEFKANWKRIKKLVK